MKSKKMKLYAHHGPLRQEWPTVLIDQQWLRAMNIASGRSIWLAIGSTRLRVMVQSNERSQTVLLPVALLHALGIHEGLSLRIKFDEASQTLRLGPVVAVLLQQASRLPSSRPFGEMSDFCRELVAAAQREGVWLVVVTPHSMKTTQKTMHGWTFRRYWTRAKLPLPDVIYNRLQTRKAEKKPAVQQQLRHLKTHFNIAIFNEQFLDKIHVFSALQRDPGIQKHLPHSVAANQVQHVRHMVNKYPITFLKPATGSMGRGIVRISRLANGMYQTQTTHLHSTVRQQFTDQTRLLQHLKSRIRRQPHLIQQGLSLLTVHRQNLDFRVLVQKDRQGKWSITSIVARIASPRHFVSNLARGGKLTTVNDALLKARLGRLQARKLHEQLRHIALLIASALDKQMNGQFGELGVDLAIDQQQQIWLLEVNSKPSKTDGLLPNVGKIRPSAHKAIQYARFLSKL